MMDNPNGFDRCIYGVRNEKKYFFSLKSEWVIVAFKT